MNREGDPSDHALSSSSAAPGIGFHPAPLAQRPAALATSVLNSALSEDLVSRHIRPPLPSLLKDDALGVISKEIAENESQRDIGIEDGARLVLDEIMNAFLTDVVQEACKLAKRRKTTVLHGRDVGLVMNKRYGLNIPGSGVGSTIAMGQGGSTNNEHSKRMAAIRKANAQAKRQRCR